MRSLLLTLALLGAARPALAGDGAAAEAKAHFDAGQKAFADGDYGTAVREYLHTHRLSPHPDLLVNIATSWERLYKPEEARKTYERYLDEAGESGHYRALALNRLRVLRALPGGILVDANRPGAAIRLTGPDRGAPRTLTGKTPHHFEDLPPGSYRVHVGLDNYAPKDVEVQLTPGAEAVVPVLLEHEVEMLTVFSKPEGARVFLDEREEGATPFSRPVDVGRRRLRVEALDVPPYHEEIDLKRGQPVRRQVTLRRPFRSGRSELVLGGMVYGGLAGAGIAEAAGGARLDGVVRLLIDTGATIAGVGVGFLLSALLTDDYLRVGQSSVIIGGTAWGTTMGAALAFGLKLSGPNTLAAGLGGGALGLGTGILVASLAAPSAGDAAIVNSGGLWGTMTGLLLSGAIGFSSEQRGPALGWLTLGGCGLGVLTGALLSRRVEVTRGHVAVVDAFGLGGLGLAFAIGYGLGTSSGAGVETGARYGLGGMTIGLLGGAILSRNFKDDLPPSEALITHHGRWAFGIPQVQIGSQNLPEGKDLRLTALLARGDF